MDLYLQFNMTLSTFKTWVSMCAQNSKCKISKISLKKSKEWIYSNESVIHKSNRYFKVIGVKWFKKNKITKQLLIDQREIGTLGFILKINKIHNTILIQAKVEPGNVNLAQIAPTCQATQSNLDQVHGGKSIPYSKYFNNSATKILNSSLQSEQGTRFYFKRNKNIIITTNSNIVAVDNFKWIKIKLLCKALGEDYLVNTDARSVLVTSYWNILTKNIFNKKTKFVQELNNSYYSNINIINNKQILNLINDNKKKISETLIIPISNLSKTDINNTDYKLIHIQVKTKGREIDEWDQPIIQSKTKGKYTLYCGRQNNTLYFCFQLRQEPGLYNKVELGPYKSKLKQNKIIKSCWQSDEGGRFYQDKSKYSLIDIGEIKNIKPDQLWLNLKQVQKLCLIDGIFCNEARSAISLILTMM